MRPVIGIAIGSVILAPISEMVGRRPVYIVSTLLFTILIIPCGLATSLPEVVIVRFFGALAGSAMIANRYVHFEVTLPCLVSKFGSHTPILRTFWAPPPPCPLPNFGLQDKVLKQTPAPAPETMSLIHFSAFDQAMLTQKLTQVRIFGVHISSSEPYIEP